MKRTPLFEEHQKLNARIIEFGGWEMPVMYSSIIDEHNAVRAKAGIFDTSHMGEIVISGPDAASFLKKITVTNVDAMAQGQAKYSFFLNENAGVIDDLLIYRRENDFLLVVNASNIEKDHAWLMKNRESGVNIEDISPQTCLLALQGPDSLKYIQPYVKQKLDDLKYYHFMSPLFCFDAPENALISRTGYTGEDGFEIMADRDAAKHLWKRLVSDGVKPCGLGARDSLRLEACMSLHGHEISDTITPLEAGLNWAINWDNDFIGKGALLKQKEKGPAKFLRAFILDSGIAREKCEITLNSKVIGKVTSGTFSPTLKKGICLGYVGQKLEIDSKVEIIVHNNTKTAKVVKKPFYRSPHRFL
jgi:aminomethyltransferase